jgi:hypothetical protein
MFFSLLQNVARPQPKALVARIERHQWCGELHLGHFEARILLVKVLCCAFFPLVRMASYFLWLAFDEDRPRFVFFGVCLLALLFSPKKQVPMVTPQDWLKGTKWDGMECPELYLNI